METDVLQFDKIATTIFAPVYPIIAEQILGKTKITKGICVDIGCAGGYLGIPIAKKSELYVYLMDVSKEMINLASLNIEKEGLENKMSPLCADVQDIPLEDNSVDLVVSRGSVFFWEDRVRAFKEIYRILRKGGCAYIGGGFGTKKLHDEINKKMLLKNPGWEKDHKERIGGKTELKFSREITEAGISDFNVLRNSSGIWIYIRRDK